MDSGITLRNTVWKVKLGKIALSSIFLPSRIKILKLKTAIFTEKKLQFICFGLIE